MKKIVLSLLVILMAFGAVATITSCSPTAGLEEIDFEDIANANLSGTYSVKNVTTTYESDGTSKKSESDVTTLSGSQVKVSVAADKASVEVIKLLFPNSYGEVCANKNYSKIVTYIYTRDSDNKITSKSVTTYSKK